jgi:hypothetical protein
VIVDQSSADALQARDVPLPYSIGSANVLKTAKDVEDDEQMELEQEAESTVHPLKRFKSYVSNKRTASIKRTRTWRDRGPGMQATDSSTEEGGKGDDADTDRGSSDDKKEDSLQSGNGTPADGKPHGT